MIDLTHTLTDGIPLWHGTIDKLLTDAITFDECTTTTTFHAQRINNMPCGTGTHLDAPAHCIKNGWTIDQIPLSYLKNTYRLFNIKKLDNEYTITLEMLYEYERVHGELKKNEWLIINTGWSQRWPDADLYANGYHFPHLSVPASKYLASKNLAGVGIDTLSVDTGLEDFPAHHILLSNNVLVLENLNTAGSLLSATGTIMIAPLLVQDATESPCRVFIY